MKRWLSVVAVAAASVAMVSVAVDAEAKRLGAGRNLGVQRQAIPQKPAPAQPPASQAAPTTPPSQAAAPAAGAPAAGAPVAAKPASAAQSPAAGAAAAPRSGMSRWLGPIAGLAAGLGLAALLSHLGLSEAFASFLLLALIAVGVVFAVRWFLRRGSPAGQRPAYAGAGSAGNVPLGRDAQAARPAPVERHSHAAPGGDHRIEPTLSQPSGTVPQGFDAIAFLQHARANFNRLQAAWDKGDLASIRDFVTPGMYAEIERDVAARQGQRPTEVVKLDGEVVEVKTESDAHWVGVRFTGLIREDGSETATPFDEVWNLTKPVDGSTGWLLAGIEQR